MFLHLLPLHLLLGELGGADDAAADAADGAARVLARPAVAARRV